MNSDPDPTWTRDGPRRPGFRSFIQRHFIRLYFEVKRLSKYGLYLTHKSHPSSLDDSTERTSSQRTAIYAQHTVTDTHTHTSRVSRLSLTSHTQTRRHPRCVCTTVDTRSRGLGLSNRLPSLAYALTNTSHNAMQLSTQPLSHTLTPKRKGIYNTQRHVHENGALLFSSSCHR